MRKFVYGFSTRSDTNKPILAKNMDRDLRFGFNKEEDWYCTIYKEK